MDGIFVLFIHNKQTRFACFNWEIGLDLKIVEYFIFFFFTYDILM